MDAYPRWDELGAADRLRIAALEAESVGLPEPFLEALHAAADLLEPLWWGGGCPARARTSARNVGPRGGDFPVAVPVEVPVESPGEDLTNP